jgi:hypothetical protein
MRYVLLDLHGNQRESFDSREELVAELQEALRAEPRSLKALYVVSYDDDGHEVGRAQRADEVVLASRRSLSTWRFDFVNELVSTEGAAIVAIQQARQPGFAGRSH